MSLFQSNNTESRIVDFKAGINKDESRRKRQELSLNNRRNRRFENLRKKRNVVALPVELNGLTNGDLPRLMQAIMETEGRPLFEAVSSLKKLLSKENEPPTEEVCQYPAVLRKLVMLLKERDGDLVLESAWALTNIASGDNGETYAVVQAGAIPLFVELAMHPREDIREQSIWALGNISGESLECRDEILKHNGMNAVIANLESSNISTLRNSIWTASNLCRGKDKPDWMKVACCVSPVCRLLDSTNDPEALADCLWTLSYITDDEDIIIQAILNEIDLQRLFTVVSQGDSKIRHPGIRTIGNFISGNDSQTAQVCQAGALRVVADVINSAEKTSLIKESVWIISNAAAGSEEIIQDLIDSQVMTKVFYYLRNGLLEIRRECLWTISNMASTGSQEQVYWLVQNGCLESIIDLLDISDSKLLLVAISALDFIFSAGDELTIENPYTIRFEQLNGLSPLEDLQEHDNVKIYKKSQALIERFFGGEEDSNEAWGTSEAPSFSGFNF